MIWNYFEIKKYQNDMEKDENFSVSLDLKEICF